MKLLLSAFGCQPNKGSEHGIGWNWALEADRLGHEVWVLTRAVYRSSIEEELSHSPSAKNINFVYYDLPQWALRWWKNINLGVYLYYLVWQWRAYVKAKRVHAIEQFDRVQHITFGSFRQPSFLGNLGIPFAFGPVGGGERAPWRLRMGYGWRGWIKDGVRDLANLLTRIDPMAWRNFKQAKEIYVTTEQTLSLLPRKYRQKAFVQLAIGFNSSELPSLSEQCTSDPRKKDHFRILYTGRLLYWKGMHLGIQAFADLLKELPYAEMTIVGSGPSEERWRSMAEKLGVEKRIDWIPWLDREKLSALYNSHDAFLFPSLHDSGGMVVLEAMAHGLPVVCLDLGGPGVIVDNNSGCVIPTQGKSESQVSFALTKALMELGRNSTHYNKMSSSARQRVQNFTWQQVVKNSLPKEIEETDISRVHVKI